MGFLAGASAKYYVSGDDLVGMSPKTLAFAASASALIFVAFTAVKYPAAFVFAALGELVVGALVAGFLSARNQAAAAGFVPLGLIIAWIAAVA